MSSLSSLSSLLTLEQLEEFRSTGILVVEDAISSEKVTSTRTAFHKHLLKLGINHDEVLAGKAEVPGARIKSPVGRIFYPSWKFLDIHLDSKVTGLATELLIKTYGTGTDPDYIHPYEPFSSIRAYVDRICWRLPDCVRAEGGLNLHLDRDPVDPYLTRCGGLSRWRPIQALVCLTDHFDGDSGGLRVVPGFHKRIDSYFKDKVSEGGGEFCRLNSVKHDVLQRQCRPVVAPAGSIVFWDNRLPHATSPHLSGCDTREVIYTGFLPDTELNRMYISKQLDAIKKNIIPPAYTESDIAEAADRDWTLEKDLTDMQRLLLGMNDGKKDKKKK